VAEGFTTNTFTMDCPNCGLGTIHFLDGEMVPHGCDYEPPALVIRCDETPGNGRSPMPAGGGR